LSPDAGGASLVANPPEMAAKSLDLNKALIFFGYFFASRQKSDDDKCWHKLLIIKKNSPSGSANGRRGLRTARDSKYIKDLW